MNFQDQLERLFPGEEVVLAEGMTVKVTPVKVKHLPEFSKAIQSAMPVLLRDGVNPIEGDTVNWKSVLPLLIPIIIENMLGIVNECVSDIDIMELPHEYLPPLITSWLSQSFGDLGKLQPWITSVEAVVHKLTGKEIQIWSTLSKPLSAMDTDGKISKSTA